MSTTTAVNITGLNRAAVLAKLYNNSRTQGMGALQARPGEMTEEEAKQLLQQSTSFDYLYGKVMKLSLKNDESFDPWGYDRDLGQGKAERVIQNLRDTGSVGKC